MTMRVDVSIGPVQGFVAQSRRTRDLWGSSYLLSFLSAHAMAGARAAGGRIVQPLVEDDPLYRWVSGRGDGDLPRLGSVPNHFVVETDEDVRMVAGAAGRALDAAWKRVCDAVWKRFVEPSCPAGAETDRIWDRQVGGFWEVVWTAGSSPAGGGLLARRKHWRSHRSPDEPGDKCTVMHDLQELSGHVRGRRGGGQRQDDFWAGMRERLGALEIRDNERLCAIALVKRVFPKVSNEALGWPVDGAQHWPSTVYVGAVPWLRDVAAIAPTQAREYAEAVRRSTSPGVLAERRTPFKNLLDPAAGDFPALDANFFHRASLKDERLCPLASGAPVDARTDLDRALKQVYCARDATGRSPGPSPAFYALLLADGDRLGKLVGRLGGEPVGRALAAFTRAVRDVVVRDHDGVAVYAGGDDVLAMLFMPRAIACASALSDRYRNAFADQQKESGATLSAAVVFAPVRHPLGAVIAEARWLLDAVAKDANGRDSLAAAVLKNSGTYCRWVTTWTRRGPDGKSRPAADLLDRLTGPLGGDAAGPVLSSGLLYRIREMLTRLGGWSRWRPGMWGALPPECDARTFLKAEILHSLTARAVERAETRADELTDLVWAALAPSRASAGRTETGVDEAGVDALLLARFLADPDREEDDE